MILATDQSNEPPRFEGVEEAMQDPRHDVRLFGKPSTRPYRRMGVVIAYDALDGDMDHLRRRAAEAAAKVKVNP